jgi:kynurenine 3-monooxygenase
MILGADGSHSKVRDVLMRNTRMDYQQRYIDTFWCEFRIQRVDALTDVFPPHISQHHLHIWPGQDCMFIAIPNTVSVF